MKFIHLTLMLMILFSACSTESTPHPYTPTAASTSTASPSPTSTPTPAPPGWCSAKPDGDFLIIGYLPDYRELNPKWGKCLTDIIYFSAEPETDGGLNTSRLDENVLQNLREMRADSGTRILVSIGGWERSDRFAAMAAHEQTRKYFVASLAEYIYKNKLNGADFDWEFPQNKAEFQNYILLLQEIHADFRPKGLILSVALSPDSEFPLEDFSVVDRIHIMSYDRGPQHSTYEQAVQDLQTFLDAGLPRQKLILGIPFYGRETTPPYNESTYAEIIGQYHPSPEIDEVNGIYFNGIETIQKKTCLAFDANIGGVMVWELGQDTTDNTSLLQAIQRTTQNSRCEN